MNSFRDPGRGSSPLKIVFAIVALFVLWRLFPLVVRFAEGAALSSLRFWWVLLLFALVGMVIYFVRRRR